LPLPSPLFGEEEDIKEEEGFLFFAADPAIELVADPKIFQNLNVSSADAETIISPSGDFAKCNTRDV